MTKISKIGALALSALLALSGSPTLAQETRFAPAADLASEAQGLYVEVLRRAPALRADAQVFDPAALTALVGDAVSITWATAEPDAATGAMRLTDIRVTLPGDTPQEFMAVEDALVWGFDTAALTARIRGERLGDTIRLFDRIELSGVSFDLADYSNMLDTALTDLTGDGPEGRTEYEVSTIYVGQLVADGFTLHPWTHSETETQDKGAAAIQLLSAIASSFSLDSLLFTETVSLQELSTNELFGELIYQYPHYLLQSYDRGRIAGMYQSDATFSLEFEMEQRLFDNSSPGPFLMTGVNAYGAWTDIDFSTLLVWGERGEMPPVTECNLWSFGRYVADGTAFQINDVDFLRAGRIEMTATDFAWFLPERVSLGYQDMAIDLAGFLNFADSLLPPDELDAGEPRPAEIAGLLERAGLARIAGDGMLDIVWNAETGETLIENRGVKHGLFSGLMRFQASFPSYAELVPAFGEDGRTPDEDALGELMDARAAFNGAEIRLTDLGGFDTIARFVIELARSGYVDDPTLASFADQTPQGLRLFASGMIALSSGALTAELPQARPWLASLTQFISTGGTFAILLDPKQPINSERFETGTGLDDLSPDALINLLGVSVTHTPAAE